MSHVVLQFLLQDEDDYTSTVLGRGKNQYTAPLNRLNTKEDEVRRKRMV